MVMMVVVEMVVKVVGMMRTKVVCSNTSPQQAAPLSRPNHTTAKCTLG